MLGKDDTLYALVDGIVKDKPHTIEGGHLFFTLMDDSGEIEAAAYEPTKNFPLKAENLSKFLHFLDNLAFYPLLKSEHFLQLKMKLL